jgi:hypothetical protein
MSRRSLAATIVPLSAPREQQAVPIARLDSRPHAPRSTRHFLHYRLVKNKQVVPIARLAYCPHPPTCTSPGLCDAREQPGEQRADPGRCGLAGGQHLRMLEGRAGKARGHVRD